MAVKHQLNQYGGGFNQKKSVILLYGYVRQSDNTQKAQAPQVSMLRWPSASYSLRISLA